MLHAPQPMTLAAMSALPMGPWMAAHWLLAIGAILTAGGLTAFGRHLARTGGEGWSVLGVATSIATAALLVVIVAPEIVAFDALRATSTDPGAQHAYLAINLNLMSLVFVAGPLYWLGIAFFGLAMLSDAAWPRWLGMAGVAVAVINIAANWVVQSFTVSKVLFMLGSAWLVIAGVLFSRLAGKAVEQPGVTAPAGAYKAGQGAPIR
jgi:hypothetical protein